MAPDRSWPDLKPSLFIHKFQAQPEEQQFVSLVTDLIDRLDRYSDDYLAALEIETWVQVEQTQLNEKRRSFVAETDKVRQTKDFDAERKLRHAFTAAIGQVQKKMRYSRLAHRGAAFSIYHFGHSLDGLIKAVRQTKDFVSFVNTECLNLLQPTFEREFPKSTRARNAVGHSAENFKNERKRDANEFSGSFHSSDIVIENACKIVVSGVLTTDGLVETFMRDIVAVQLTLQKHRVLEEIKRLVFEALMPAASELARRSEEKARANISEASNRS